MAEITHLICANCGHDVALNNAESPTITMTMHAPTGSVVFRCPSCRVAYPLPVFVLPDSPDGPEWVDGWDKGRASAAVELAGTSAAFGITSKRLREAQALLRDCLEDCTDVLADMYARRLDVYKPARVEAQKGLIDRVRAALEWKA